MGSFKDSEEKNMKQIFIVIKLIILQIFLISTTSGSEICPKNAMRTMYNYRYYIAELLDSCEPDIIGNGDTIPCDGTLNHGFFQSYLNKPYEEWEKEAWKLFEYGGVFRKTNRIKQIKSDFLLNDTLIKMLISFLGDTSRIRKMVIESSYMDIMEKVPYPLLRKYSAFIKETLKDTKVAWNAYDPYRDDMKKLKLLIMVGLSDDEKKYYLNKDYLFDEINDYLNSIKNIRKRKSERNKLDKKYSLPLHYRAALGDKGSLNKLIAAYDSITPDTGSDIHIKEEKYKKKKELAEKLLFVGTAGIKHLLKKFNEPMYRDWSGYLWQKRKPVVNKSSLDYYRKTNDSLYRYWSKFLLPGKTSAEIPDSVWRNIKCYVESIRLPIILGLHKYHPHEQLFYSFKKNSSNDDSLRVLYKKFSDWARVTYGVTPEGREPDYLKLSQRCVRPKPFSYNEPPDRRSAEEKNQENEKLMQELKKLPSGKEIKK